MPTPIKYDNPDIQNAYKAVERVAEQKLLSMLPPELQEDYQEVITVSDPQVHALVKAADKLSAYLKCVEELKAGNTEFKKAKEQTYAALCQNPIPALQYFMEHFLDGFELTLDELT
jgi:5'-deoxynucleotidase